MVTQPNQTNLEDELMNFAMEAKYDTTKVYFGQMIVEKPWECILIKGEGKVKFDKDIHPADQKNVCLGFALLPLPGSKITFSIERDPLVHSKKGEWPRIMQASMKALGLDLRTLNNRWVQVEMVPFDEYTDKNGEKKPKTIFKIVQAFDSPETCQEAADRFFSRREEKQDALGLSQPADAPNNPEKKTASLFLPTLWKQANGNIAEFAKKIAETELTAKYFTLNSPEVLAIIQPAAA